MRELALVLLEPEVVAELLVLEALVLVEQQEEQI